MSDKTEQLDKALETAKAKLDKTRDDEKSSAESRQQAEADYRRLTNLARHRNESTFDAKFDKVADAHPKLLRAVTTKRPAADPEPETPPVED